MKRKSNNFVKKFKFSIVIIYMLWYNKTQLVYMRNFVAQDIKKLKLNRRFITYKRGGNASV